jgi:hypothetical protein
MLYSVRWNAGPFQRAPERSLGQGVLWNLPCTGWPLSGDLLMQSAESFSRIVTLPNEHRIEIPEAVVVWTVVVDTMAFRPKSTISGIFRARREIDRLSKESVREGR